MEEKLARLQEMLNGSKHIVFFGGAGVSTESQIPDFRSSDGIYRQKQFRHPPEVMLSHEFYMEHPGEFFDFYRTMLFPDAKPNAAHRKLAQWEAEGRLKAVITQNIDGLHQMAGSKTVYELHGSVKRNYCTSCGAFYDESLLLEKTGGIPHCEKCGGTVKPDVVLYGEGLDNTVINHAVEAIREADMLIIGGTSLVVYPAAGLIHYYEGNKLVLINGNATSYDSKADLLITGRIGEVLGAMK
ncbi:MAG TPA: NAD-dependent protein deacylase [Clostridiales bacterium]|nr:NAD-dependent protein deacylase [Clostridiales bacterium]